VLQRTVRGCQGGNVLKSRAAVRSGTEMTPFACRNGAIRGTTVQTPVPIGDVP
jgi:hypothetical protein